MQVDRAGRRRLRDALAVHAAWLLDPEVGPTTVDAGSCDRCDDRPRVVATCGPISARTLCVDCILAVGDDGWCDGHREVAVSARRWARAAPPWWSEAVVLWWVATGEVRPDPGEGDEVVVDKGMLPASVRAALTVGG